MKTGTKRCLGVLLSMLMVIALLPTTTIRAKASSGVDDFVTRCYRVALDREPEPAGFADWTNKLNNGALVGCVVAYDFIFSEEYKAKNKSDDLFVKDLYKMFLGRDSEEDGYRYWMQKLTEEKVGRETVFAGFSNSKEFVDLCTGYGITAGYYSDGYTTDQINNVNLFVERLYKTTLNRIGDPTGQEYWVKGLFEKKINGVQCAVNFIQSEEYVNKNLSNEEYVDNLYAGIMGRTPDEVGRKYWLDALNNKTMTRDQVFEGFSKSAEFKAICEAYGIECGTYTATDRVKKRVKTSYKYDSNGALSERVDFDINGNVTKRSGKLESYGFEYNKNGDITKKVTYNNEGELTLTETYEYDKNYNLIKYSKDDSKQRSVFNILYDYDSNQRLITTRKVTIGYDENTDKTPWLCCSFEYNSEGDLVRRDSYYLGQWYAYEQYTYPQDGKTIVRTTYSTDGTAFSENKTEYLINGSGIKYTLYDSDNGRYEGYYYCGAQKKPVKFACVYSDLEYNYDGMMYDSEIPKVLNDGYYRYEYDEYGNISRMSLVYDDGYPYDYVNLEHNEDGYLAKQSYYTNEGSLWQTYSFGYDYY